MDYKIVFFDVDGNITHHEDGSISNNTKEAIKTLKNKGLRVVAATRRPLSIYKEIRAFSDGENDIDMLELVGLGVAMGNGNEKCENGIEFALKKYGII